MATCKRCGSALPGGARKCDLCSTPTGNSQAPPAWKPPENVDPVELASGSASWHSTKVPHTWKTEASQRRETQESLSWGWTMTGVLGFCCIGVGVFAELTENPDLLPYFGWPTVGLGVLFLGLAFYIRRNSLAALGLAAAMCALGMALLGKALKGNLSLLAPAELLQGTVFGVLFRAVPAMLAVQPPANTE